MRTFAALTCASGFFNLTQRTVRHDKERCVSHAPENPAQKLNIAPGYRSRFWHARFWHGMKFSTWFNLLARNRFRVTPDKIWLALTITPVTLINSVMGWIQDLIYPHRVGNAQMPPPIFIIGHWRSGTTMLHELLMLDARFTAPDTFQCMCPNHFILSAPAAMPLTFLVPKQRPMDSMASGWDKPQEDEFGLMNMGLPSPYLDIAFPREASVSPDALSLERLAPETRQKWTKALDRFLSRVWRVAQKRVVVKSPTHTARVKTLLAMYPKAKFILISRDPYAVFNSTVKLWYALQASQGLQPPAEPERLQQKVFDEYVEMFEALNAARPLIPHGQFCQMHYADLVADPLAEMERAYAEAGLGEFAEVRSRIEAYFAERADYQPDAYPRDPALAAELDRRWGHLFAEYGYGPLSIAGEKR